MRKNIRKIPSFNHIQILVLLFLFSCVYYNTFYNAEVSFIKANKIIEESPIILEDEIPPQAKKLLAQVIENANIVIEKYPNSKYVDDAYFITLKATFLKGEYANSEKYINILIGSFMGMEFLY